jgi:hypothetical protein
MFQRPDVTTAVSTLNISTLKEDAKEESSETDDVDGQHMSLQMFLSTPNLRETQSAPPPVRPGFEAFRKIFPYDARIFYHFSNISYNFERLLKRHPIVE